MAGMHALALSVDTCIPTQLMNSQGYLPLVTVQAMNMFCYKGNSLLDREDVALWNE